MTLPQIKPELLERLAALAEEQGKDVNEMVEDALDYLSNQIVNLDEKVDAIMQKHQNLLDRLA